ncbi:MAG: S-layer homology domain-containing protein [Defluviitaleaceae bacterium]|nr:S-layer homology domain-containing protein [Defluviitaleaceae bacterium]
MKKIILCVCLTAILVLSAVVPVSACWAPLVPFEIFSEDGSRVFVFAPDEYGMGVAYATVYEILNGERQPLYTVEYLDSFAYESNFHFTTDMTHFIRTFPAPGIPVFEVFSYGVRTRVVLRSDFIEDYFAGAEGPPALSVGPSFTVGWQIIDRSPDGSTITINTGEDNTFVFDIMTVAFIGDDLPSWVQNPSDDTPSSWAYESVERAGELGLLPDTFRSGFRRSTTRAEFATIAIALYEHFREPITGRISFTDTTNTNVEKAAYLGIVTGVGNNRFDPNSPITREQAAVMLDRLVGLFGFHSHNVFPRFYDHQEISAWAMLAVGHIQAREIMSGVGSNRFTPQDLYTIEQSIVTIMRIFDLINNDVTITMP